MAAPLGLIAHVVLNAQGQPVTGASVQVQKQGATIQSAADSTHIEVDDPGAILIGDIVQVNQQGASPSVTNVTANEITLGSSAGTVSNNARLAVISPLPTLYADPQGNETKANPLSTDANGLAFAYAPIAPYDIYASGGNAPNGPVPGVLIRDFPAQGLGNFLSYMMPGVGSGAIDLNFARSGWGVTQGLIRALVQGALKATLYGSGRLELADGLHIQGGVLTVDGGTTVSFPVGSIAAAAVAGSALDLDMAYDDDTVDYTITTTPTAIPNVGVAYTPAASSSKLFVCGVVPFEGPQGESRKILATLFEDATPIAEAASNVYTLNTNQAGVIALIAPIRTGSAAARTYTIKVSKDAGASTWTVKNSSDRKARIVVIEAKT